MFSEGPRDNIGAENETVFLRSRRNRIWKRLSLSNHRLWLCDTIRETMKMISAITKLNSSILLLVRREKSACVCGTGV